jgi:hypothetical protein
LDIAFAIRRSSVHSLRIGLAACFLGLGFCLPKRLNFPAQLLNLIRLCQYTLPSVYLNKTLRDIPLRFPFNVPFMYTHLPPFRLHSLYNPSLRRNLRGPLEIALKLLPQTRNLLFQNFVLGLNPLGLVQRRRKSFNSLISLLLYTPRPQPLLLQLRLQKSNLCFQRGQLIFQFFVSQIALGVYSYGLLRGALFDVLRLRRCRRYSRSRSPLTTVGADLATFQSRRDVVGDAVLFQVGGLDCADDSSRL